jgi:hypothetical protein
MINLKFTIPFFLLFIHQHLSNSVIGLNNPIIGISLFITFIFSLFIFLTFNEKVGNIKYLAISLAIVLIFFWFIKPLIFKNLAFFYINLFITYYIITQNGLQYIKRHLTFLVVTSAILLVFQISGITSLFHLFNSQYLIESSDGIVQKIEITNILSSNIDQYFDFDSRQVRPPGIFHSSAVTSGIFVLYISYIFLGILKATKYYLLIPFLCIYSGSKLVLTATLLFFILSILFRRITVKEFCVLILSTLICIISHKTLFNYLIDFQFNYDIFIYSLDIRVVQYSMENLDFNYIFKILFIISLIFLCIILINNIFKFITSSIQIYNFLILFIVMILSFSATPHVANLLFGWLYFPSFFFLKKSKNIHINSLSFA